MSTVDISKVQDYAEKHKKELLNLAVMNAEVIQKMDLVAGVTDKYTMTELAFKKIFKPYAKAWDPDSNKAELIPRTGRVEIGQVELEEEPLRYLKTYLGNILKGGVNPEEHPFEKEFLEGIVKRVSNDINDDLAFFGDYALRQSQDPAIAKSVKSINNGFFTIIDKEVAANNISEAKGNLIKTGDINSTNAVAKLKSFYRKACTKMPALRSQTVRLYISFEVYDAYNDNYQAINGALPYNKEFEKTFLEGSANRCILEPMSSMGISKRIMLGPFENFKVLVDQISDQEDITVFNPGNPKVMGFFLAAAIGFEFMTLNALWTNEAEVDGDASGSPSASASASASASPSGSPS